MKYQTSWPSYLMDLLVFVENTFKEVKADPASKKLRNAALGGVGALLAVIGRLSDEGPADEDHVLHDGQGDASEQLAREVNAQLAFILPHPDITELSALPDDEFVKRIDRLLAPLEHIRGVLEGVARELDQLSQPVAVGPTPNGPKVEDYLNRQ